MKNNNNKMRNEKGTMRNYASSLLSAFSFLLSKAFLLSAFSFLLLITSCSNELDETLQPAGNGTLQFVVSDFPAFGENPETRVIGTQDDRKTEWENGDKILVHLYSQKYKDQAVTLIYNANTWEPDGDIALSYLENEIPTITAVYAPDCEIKSDKTIGLSEGKTYGTAEYIPAKTTIEGNALKISFESGRTYSRLRIAALADQELSVTTTGFTPAGTTTVATAPTSYTLTTDNNGNAFLYGIFEKDATVTVKHGTATLADFTFSEDKDFANGTEQGKSYALDARPVIDGTFGGKTTATDAEIEVLVQQIKTYVDNGITTITVTGSKSPIIDMGNYTTTAIGEAIYRLSGSGYEQNSIYLGKIDLILPDVTEIVDWEFQKAYALNSINLPKVTTIGDGAFQDCWYLQKLTFGSVVTSINGTGSIVFGSVGKYVDGGLCDLVLNKGQANAETKYQPDLLTNQWWNYTQWKSITLI